MKAPSLSIIVAALLCAGITYPAAATGDVDSVVTAVFSRSFNNYARPVLPDGTDKPQTYVVSKGGYTPGLGADASIDDVKFAGIVRILAVYLAKQGYFPAKDGKKADLMLVVHWGKTVPFNHSGYDSLLNQGLQGFEALQRMGLGVGASPGFPSGGGSSDRVSAALASQANEEMMQGLFEIQFGQRIRDSENEYNANLLGYTADLKYRGDHAPPSLYAGAGTAYYDLIDDIESERYYVAITAYDFQEALQHNHKQGLWRTIASIDARGNRFDERLMAMVDRASRYFGRDSGRLIRQFEYTPHVSYGELQVLGVIEKTSEQKK